MEDSNLRDLYNPEGSVLRQTQMMMQDILDQTVVILKANNIRFWIEGGTLLGAKRHGGFIPWDDDLDIDIDHRDYQKAMELLEKHLPDSLYLELRGKDPNYRLKWAKVKDRNSIFDENDTKTLKQRGVFIDIFNARRVGDIRYKATFALQKLKSNDQPFWMKIAIELAIKAVCIATLFEKKNSFITDNMYMQYRYPIDMIYPLGEIKFEGKLYPAPHDVESYLVAHYGDWQRIPSKDKIVQHAVKITLK